MNKKIYHKLGANRNEVAHRSRKREPNFAQSRDICEDRSERQFKQFLARGYGRIQY